MDQLRRRRILIAAALPLVARLAAAQQRGQPRRLGILSADNQQAAEWIVRVISDRLAELGWQRGRNLEIDLRRADVQDNLGMLAAALVGSRPDVLIAVGPYATLRLKEATQSIPIVFSAVADPVGNGLVASLARPGGNITGVTHIVGFGLFAKYAQILKELVPAAARFAFLVNPDTPGYRNSATGSWDLQPLKISSFIVRARNAQEIPAAIETAVRDRADGLVVLPDSILAKSRELLVKQAMDHKLPGIYPDSTHVQLGGLVSYSADFSALFVRSAELADKVLRGAKPADLPVEQPTKFELAINVKTARALAITVPKSILLRADHVIE